MHSRTGDKKKDARGVDRRSQRQLYASGEENSSALAYFTSTTYICPEDSQVKRPSLMLISPRLLPFLASCLYHFCFETRVSRNPVNIYISSTFGEGQVDKLGEIPEISQIPFVYLVQTALYYSFSLSLLFLSLCTPCPIYCILHLGFYSFLDSYCFICSGTKKKCVRVKGEKGGEKKPR